MVCGRAPGSTHDDFDEDEKKINVKSEEDRVKPHNVSEELKAKFHKYQAEIRDKCEKMQERHLLSGPITELVQYYYSIFFLFATSDFRNFSLKYAHRLCTGFVWSPIRILRFRKASE